MKIKFEFTEQDATRMQMIDEEINGVDGNHKYDFHSNETITGNFGTMVKEGLNVEISLTDNFMSDFTMIAINAIEKGKKIISILDAFGGQFKMFYKKYFDFGNNEEKEIDRKALEIGNHIKIKYKEPIKVELEEGVSIQYCFGFMDAIHIILDYVKNGGDIKNIEYVYDLQMKANITSIALDVVHEIN